VGDAGADISPPRWDAAREGMEPPEAWAWPAGSPNVCGQPLDVPATTPWALCPGVEASASAVRLKCRELKVCSLSPDWINRQGLEEMAASQVKACVITHLTSFDGGDQLVAHHLALMCVAIQVKNNGFFGRATSIVKYLWEKGEMDSLNWPGLEEINVQEIKLRVPPSVNYGEVLFDIGYVISDEPWRLNFSPEERHNLLSLSKTLRLPEMSERDFVNRGYLRMVVDSDQLGVERRGLFYGACPEREQKRFDEGVTPTPHYNARAVREWLNATQVDADTWDWPCAT
jgi:hypothetical protein